jgi:N-acetyltransferase
VTPSAPDGRPLVGERLRLDLACPEDADELFAVLDHDEVWASGYGGGRPAGSPGEWRDAVAAAAGTGRRMYVARAGARVVGTSSLGDLDLANERVHLGWTAYDPAVWGTVVNPQCKRLLLGHAFDDCGLGRVKIQTDAINARSQAAIAKLGAVREGVLRRHMRRADGSFRDTVVFSVVTDEWPAVRDRLDRRIAEAPPLP